MSQSPWACKRESEDLPQELSAMQWHVPTALCSLQQGGDSELPLAGREQILHHRAMPVSHAAPLSCSAPPAADTEDHPTGVPPDLAALSTGGCGAEEQEGTNTSPTPKGTSSCCSDTPELMLHRERGQAQARTIKKVDFSK